MTFSFCPVCGQTLGEREDGGAVRQACPDAECGFIYYDNPTPVVAALVEYGEHVILARNKAWPETWFGLVTGFLEREETPENGVLREVDEELGLSSEIVSLIGVYPFKQMNQVIIAYHVRAEGEIRLGEELAAYKLIPPLKLKPWPFGTGKAVRDWVEEKKAELSSNPDECE